MNLYDNILEVLKTQNISFVEISHEISTSCEHSQDMRKAQGLEGIGSKNIVFHAKGNFYIVTTLGTKEIKARNFKHEFGTKDIRFATQDEITQQIQGTIGSIPPFGYTNSNIPVYVDAEIFENEFFCFNPGIADKSIQICTTDLKKVYENIKNPVKIFDLRDEENKTFISIK